MAKGGAIPKSTWRGSIGVAFDILVSNQFDFLDPISRGIPRGGG